MHTIILGVTATTTALMSGLFFAFSWAVMPGLKRLPDASFIMAMQSINRAIQNPVFFAAFLGAALLLPLSTYLDYSSTKPVSARFWLLLAASGVYIVGVIGVTIGGNVPLNETLDAFDVQAASVSDVLNHRRDFEFPWSQFHTIRTGASFLTILLVVAACLRPENH
ncbi:MULTISPECIES: DUF1772 domain-containing protein [unclassified Spirosoma]|uniref:anthrone oxygenase family protein n=1 Tax=unclassified Spirosoma TaxID=2621999 RepID=UPI0009634F9A|nr:MULTISPECIES: DUF1772 domain-containing protein [unclassified Spirosoma]MBN8822844.1 DUF1772 domain-containing protein [Spirosoma sp.]OJW80041.1 MAG: hypothetical protein BGO59_02195 [Spirosoma sp. 48-14]